MRVKALLVLTCCLAGIAQAEPVRLPPEQRPEWLRQEGIVMAGSWEPLLYRVRRDGNPGYTPTAAQRAAYVREQSPEMIARLKTLGVNFVMMHCYKGFGLEAEQESMADAVRFAKLCHDAGLHVGVYAYSGTLGWELFFKEMPQAKEWVLRDRDGNPLTYGPATYRYYWNRNHPEAQAFYRKIVKFAVEDIHADLIHFDNYTAGPGSDRNSVSRFREYLRRTFTARQLQNMKFDDADLATRAMAGPPDTLLRRAWLDFSCESLAESYRDMSRYARTLRPDILVECNPNGVGGRIDPPVDHGRMLQGGEAFWNEGQAPGYHDGRVHSRIRTYKVARRMDNMVFVYTTTPLEMAESMAFNRDCLGCVGWFEYGKLVSQPASAQPVSQDLAPFIRFFKTRRDLFRDADVVADVAVLRSFPSQVFASPKYAQRTTEAEQTLIESRVPFQIIYDHQLNDLKRYRVLVLAGCIALSDKQLRQIREFVAHGGRLCVVGPVATHDGWMLPRAQPGLGDVDAAKIIHVSRADDLLDAIGHLCNGKLSMSVTAAPGLCAELTKQADRQLVHLVNYRSEDPAHDIEVRVLLPAGRHVSEVTLVSPEREEVMVLPVAEEQGVAIFTVPAVNVYEIAVVALRAKP